MGFPEKDPKDGAKKNADGPRLDAILPDDPPSSAAELVDDISSYQKRMEKEWETAKASYEQKINRIMNEFVVEGAPEPKDPHTGKPAPKDARLQDLIHQLESELKEVPHKPAAYEPEFFSQHRPEPMSLGWKNAPVHLTQKMQIIVSAALAVVLLTAVFFVSVWRVTQTPLPYAHTLGPVVLNKNIYIMDWFRKILFVHKDDSQLTIRSVEALPNNLATGIAMSDKTVWTLDSLDLKLNLHTVTVDHQVTDSVTAPDTKPAGLYFDGTDLWSADQDAFKLYRHRGNDVEEIRDTFPMPDATITAFLLKETQLWVLDGKSRLITVYRLQKPLLKLAAYDLDGLVKGAAPTGMALDGNTLLVVTENPSSLIRIPLFRLRHSRLKTSV